ncbi:hypothetical protein [Rugosimonospora africana]|uniref:Secreted protein n=1 Tax=Rugosimonospora africana TaxID=556532 RepID=A0A8J3R0D8_9ACTN|nr:hypothetical protein [Rugosimonospora africana]GIH19492.1 hypothetical protein Raf01_76640 [Rugosimonospora africana]
MIVRSLRRAAAALGVAIAATAVFAAVAPSSASADALRPLNVSLWCFQGGLPYGYSVNTGSGWYTPAASGDATVVNGTKTFHLLIPTTAGSLAVNTYCDGFQGATWEGYSYGITPGTSTVNASGYCNTYPYSVGYGITYWFTYCPLSSITYS